MEEKKQRIEALFNEAVGLNSLEQREAYLRKAAGQDPELLRALEGLIQAFSKAGKFLSADEVPLAETKGVPISLQAGQTVHVGDVIGGYKVLEQIGEGGCGVVYVAEQEQPIRRKVALKVIKPGMDTRQVIARFEAERQALAMMDHPNIAKVLNAGATETGMPYFVMEPVRGLKITDYSDQHHLSTRERLGLFILVCQAVHHAHQKGIIHRDLKPSNILVTVNDGVAGSPK